MALLDQNEIREVVWNALVPAARRSLVFASGKVNNVQVQDETEGVVSFVDRLEGVRRRRGLDLRILLAGTPTIPVLESLRAHPTFLQKVPIRLCVRNHMKVVVADGSTAVISSSNLTAAGLGHRSAGRTNLELGVYTSDPAEVARVLAIIEAICRGFFCAGCRARKLCHSEHLRFQAGLLGVQIPRAGWAR